MFSQELPELLVRQLVTFEPDDPEGYDVYRVEWAPFLTRGLGRRVLARALGWLVLTRGLDPRLDYFVEPSVSSSPSHMWRDTKTGELLQRPRRD